MVVNWDSSNVEDILMPACLRIFIQFIQEEFKNGQWGIPAEKNTEK